MTEEKDDMYLWLLSQAEFTYEIETFVWRKVHDDHEKELNKYNDRENNYIRLDFPAYRLKLYIPQRVANGAFNARTVVAHLCPICFYEREHLLGDNSKIFRHERGSNEPIEEWQMKVNKHVSLSNYCKHDRRIPDIMRMVLPQSLIQRIKRMRIAQMNFTRIKFADITIIIRTK